MSAAWQSLFVAAATRVDTVSQTRHCLLKTRLEQTTATPESGAVTAGRKAGRGARRHKLGILATVGSRFTHHKLE